MPCFLKAFQSCSFYFAYNSFWILGFDISPEDEVTFESSVTKDEIDEAVRKNTPGAYIPLSSKNKNLYLLRLFHDCSGSARKIRAENFNFWIR